MTALSAETLAEHALIDAARDGDDRAFEELYARYSGRITGFIHARVRDHGRSEDVAQEVFISALRRLRASSQEILFKPWIYEIAKNACIDEHRRTRRIREVSLDGGDDEAGPERLLSRAPTPPAAVETKQTLTDLRGAFSGLSESHHQLLVLRELEGLSYDEIGERTGMSRQMVESALFRARRKLTAEYEELASGRRCRQVQTAIDDGRALTANSMGVRERRVFARHLAHCQPCRTSAHLAGVDETLVSRRRLGAKIAAFLPFPLWRWPWGSARSRQAAAHFGGHPFVPTLSSAAEPAAATSLGGAAVATAVLALAGVGAVTAPAATRAERPSSRPAVVRSSLLRHAAAAPAVVLGAPGPGSAVISHGALQLGATRSVARTTTRASAGQRRRGQRTSAGPGPAGTGSSGPGAANPTSTGPSAPGSTVAAGVPALGAPVAPAPSVLSRIPGSAPTQPLNGQNGTGHVTAGPMPSTPTSVNAGTQAAGSALPGAAQAAAGPTSAAAGATSAAAGPTSAAAGPTSAAAGPTSAATSATSAAAGPTSAATQAAAGGVSGAIGAAQGVGGAASSAVTGAAAGQASGALGPAASTTAGATKTVVPLPPG